MTPPRPAAGLRDYLRIARLDHSPKHVFIVPGVMLALLLRGPRVASLPVSVALGLVAAVCVASANYTANEWLDRRFDQFHPEKSLRTAVRKDLNGRLVWAEWLGFVLCGLAAAGCASPTMAGAAALFALQGLVYNVRPLRTKDHAFLDVVSEAVNNPIRLVIGWAMVDPRTLPPSSMILLYWASGAFLMTAKRLSEYRQITASHGRALLVRYRSSFGGYDEPKLIVACLVYALVSSFVLAVFLVKYRIEYLLVAPVVVVIFAQYMVLALQPGSTAQKPERLFRERGLMLSVLLLAVLFVMLTVCDLPFLDLLAAQRFIALPP